jgi:hypothetical protein
MSGQNIAFGYDADGNMEARYVVTLRTSASAEEEKNIDKDKPIVDFHNQNIIIYPNPTRGQIGIDIISLNLEDNNNIQLYDITGKLIKYMEITSARTEIEITGASGAYLLNINLGKEVSKWKIIKQ